MPATSDRSYATKQWTVDPEAVRLEVHHQGLPGLRTFSRGRWDADLLWDIAYDDDGNPRSRKLWSSAKFDTYGELMAEVETVLTNFGRLADDKGIKVVLPIWLVPQNVLEPVTYPIPA